MADKDTERNQKQAGEAMEVDEGMLGVRQLFGGQEDDGEER
jgi:hypothetical protein